MPALIAEQTRCDDVITERRAAFAVCNQVFTGALKESSTDKREAMFACVLVAVVLPHWFLAVVAQTFLARKGRGAGVFKAGSFLGHDVFRL
jgi:hypothetical protein